MNYLNLIRNRIKQLNLDKKTIVILIVGFLGIFVMFLSEYNGQEDDSEEMVTYNTDEEYCSYLENKIQSYIEKIDGAGKTKVIITLSETTEYIYATDDKDVRKNNTNSDDATIEKDYVIIENNNNDVGLLIKTIQPKVRGVAVSCEGGDNTKVQQHNSTRD